MAEKLYMIALSPTMEEGTIIAWNKSVGDKVISGDVVCEVETDKATMDYESTQEGTLLKILIPNGGSAKVGDLIGIIGEQGEDVSGIAASPAEQSPGAADQPTETAADTAAAKPAAGQSQTSRAASPSGGAVPPSGKIKSSPLARKMANEMGIDLGLVRGSGPGGRIVKRDIEDYKTGRGADAITTAARPVGQDVTVPVSSKRAVIARRLAESKFSAPHYYLRSKVIMDSVLAARKQLNKNREKNVSFNAFLIKFAAEALKRNRRVNASWQGDSIIQFGSMDIALAVAIDDGLITPIVRNCGEKGIVEIDTELIELIAKAKGGKLQPEEFTGATFTVSNLGSYGIEEFTAIINPPGSAILAIGETVKEAIVGEGDQVDIHSTMRMTLSCDHRVIDGALGAKFLFDLKNMMQNPMYVLF
jgi:pyruvate dehydrogenase E2 component (dihydrolipoamide acetyltransferase)